jgi:ABC-2 type transport system ATP-binding protein
MRAILAGRHAGTCASSPPATACPGARCSGPSSWPASTAVLILDEPHNGLDAAAIRWLRAVLRSLAAAGRTVLLSSHLMSEIELICDDIVVIDGGRLLAATTLVDFLGGARGPGPGRRVSLEERYLDLVGEL